MKICNHFFARDGTIPPSAPGVVLEVKSVKGSMNSDKAAVVPLVSWDVASKGALVSSVVASVMQPETIIHRPVISIVDQFCFLMGPPHRENANCFPYKL